MKALVVTTVHRGVFFGYGEPTDEPTIRLERCRMAVSWPESNHGVIGLAADGPHAGARISPAAPAVTLRDVTAVMEIGDKAQKAWESAPWK